MISTPPTKRVTTQLSLRVKYHIQQTDLHWLIYQFLIQSRSRYESLYSSSLSEVEELPSLATNSVLMMTTMKGMFLNYLMTIVKKKKS